MCVCTHYFPVHLCGFEPHHRFFEVDRGAQSKVTMPTPMSLELASASPVVYNHYAHKSIEEDYLRRSVRRNAFSPSLSTAVQGLAELSPAQLQVRAPCCGC
jgi:hypothetical protein